jgi:hypothetical protein
VHMTIIKLFWCIFDDRRWNLLFKNILISINKFNLLIFRFTFSFSYFRCTSYICIINITGTLFFSSFYLF